MRKPRRLLPGQLYEVVLRCHHSRYRLLPTEERRERLGFFLAKYKQHYPDLRILAVVQMGNHLHAIVWDVGSNLSDFMRDFGSQLAKSVNRLDQVRGAVFERRFTAIPIVDIECLVKRIAYVVTNPVAAGLVRSHAEWTGLVGWFGDFEPETFRCFHEGQYDKALKAAERTGEEVHREEFEEAYTLELDPLDDLDPELVREAIREREAELRKDHPSIMGMQRVLHQDPFDRPKWSKRSAMPLCLFTKKEAFWAYVDSWFRFLDAFRAASEAFRAGHLSVRFPMFSFRPSIPSSA